MRNRNDENSSSDSDNYNAIDITLNTLQQAKEEIKLAERLFKTIQKEYKKLPDRYKKHLFSIEIVKNPQVLSFINTFCSNKFNSTFMKIASLSEYYNYPNRAEIKEFIEEYSSISKHIGEQYSRLIEKQCMLKLKFLATK